MTETTETGINPDLVKRYHLEGDLKNLLVLFDHLSKAKTRAEGLSRAYLDQINVLARELAKLREGKEGKGTKEWTQSSAVKSESSSSATVSAASPSRSSRSQSPSRSSKSPKPSRGSSGVVLDL